MIMQSILTENLLDTSGIFTMVFLHLNLQAISEPL